MERIDKLRNELADIWNSKSWIEEDILDNCDNPEMLEFLKEDLADLEMQEKELEKQINIEKCQ